MMYVQSGKLARQYCNLTLPLQVLHSRAGYYIGTFDEEGPVSRESEEYWDTRAQAEQALKTNDWSQRETP